MRARDQKLWKALAFCLLVSMGIGVGMVMPRGACSQGMDEASAVVTSFLRAVSQGDSEMAFQLCTSALRRGKSADGFLGSAEMTNVFSGMKSWEIIRMVERGSAVTAAVALHGKEGSGQKRAVGIGCLKVSGGYRVRDFSLTPWTSSEARFRRYLSDLFLRLEDLDLAEQEIERAYSLDPEDPKVYAFRGYLYLEKKVKLDEALRLIQRAQEQDPADPEYMDFLGWAHHLANRRKESVEWFDRARDAFQRWEGYQSSPEYVRFSSHVDKAKAKGWTPTQT